MKFTIAESGNFRIFFYGRFRGVGNTLPVLMAVDVVEDDPPYRIGHRWYQLSWLGYTINLNLPSNRNRRGFILDFSVIFRTILALLS